MQLTNRPFITLLHSLQSLQAGSPNAKKNILTALSATINSPGFNELNDIPFLSAAEMREQLRDCKPPMGFYSCQISAKTGQRQYIMVYLLDDNRHLYLKFMLNSMDLGVERFVMAVVDVEGKNSIHREYDDHSVPLLDFLRAQKIRFTDTEEAS